jgi:hypothetical protein
MFLRLGTVLLFLTMVAPASAHEWYPIECCSGYDCAPVEQTKISDVAELIVTSKHGTGVVPETMPRRESKDHRMHVCMRPSSDGRMRVICVFLPPSL